MTQAEIKKAVEKGEDIPLSQVMELVEMFKVPNDTTASMLYAYLYGVMRGKQKERERRKQRGTGPALHLWQIIDRNNGNSAFLSEMLTVCTILEQEYFRRTAEGGDAK